MKTRSKSMAVILGMSLAILFTTNAAARWDYWDYGWWKPRPVEVTVDTHTFTGSVESLNSTQMVITVSGRENFKTKIRWENEYVVKPIHKPIPTYEGEDDSVHPITADTHTFRIAVSCKVSTPKKSRATFADIHVGDIVTIGHSLDYKNNRVAMEIVVDKSK